MLCNLIGIKATEETVGPLSGHATHLRPISQERLNRS